MAVHRFGPRCHVHLFVWACTSEVARHHVAHCVTTCFARGQLHISNATQQIGNALQIHEVELNVLAGGDVSPSAGELSGQISHHVELLGRNRSCRQLDAHHLVRAALALTIDAVVQTHHAEHIVADLAL